MDEQAKRRGAQYRAAREALGYTQKELADMLGRGGSERTLQAFEAGTTRLRPGTLVRLRSILGIEGDPEEARAAWSPQAQVVVQVMGDLLASLPADERAAFRRRIIDVAVQGHRPESGEPWPDDVQVIADVIGAFLERGSDLSGE